MFTFIYQNPLKYNFEILVLEYVHLTKLFTSSPQHFKESCCHFYSTTYICQ